MPVCDTRAEAGLRRLEVGADLDDVQVGVAEVDAADEAGGAGALDRAFLDRDAVRGEVRDHLLQRAGGDQAQVGAAGRRATGFRLEFVTGPVQVDLAVAEGKGGAPRPDSEGTPEWP